MALFKGFSTYNRKKQFRLTDFELVKQDLFNHFNIRKGEKLMRPNFGTSVWDYLFEPFSSEITEVIREEIGIVVGTDPRLKVEKISINSYDQGLEVSIKLIFVPLNLADVLYLKFDRDNQKLVAS
jgi:phage baseplate assembly protein W